VPGTSQQTKTLRPAFGFRSCPRRLPGRMSMRTASENPAVVKLYTGFLTE
jgi:hypothetical protein